MGGTGGERWWLYFREGQRWVVVVVKNGGSGVMVLYFTEGRKWVALVTEVQLSPVATRATSFGD
ncbi:hypothetical protein HanRHA438_Chr03g0097921 [Helianthus annuus]|nr:hypothetical protein HanIR_Chr12g0610881 [Helianthus annuus]KAJ0933591.1 hypothetical protein HanRHA438_Chr03g0097921 [Helianthus annuus]